MILLLSDLHKDVIKATEQRAALGTVIDSRIDKGEGPLATVLVQAGVLHPGDLIVVGDIPGKVKAMKDFRGKLIPKALPSTPVQVLGLKSAPAVGDIMQVIEDKKVLKRMLKEHKQKKSGGLSEHMSGAKGSVIQKTILPISLKADTLGSTEAIMEALKDLQHAEIAVEVISRGLGNINERDVQEAKESGALLLGFNVRVMPGAVEAQMRAGIEVFTYDVIYDLLDYVKKEMGKLLAPDIVQTVIGKLRILATFKRTSSHRIVGGKVIEGEAQPQLKVKIMRGEQEIGSGSIVQLQLDKKNVGSVKSGQECGLKIETNVDVAAGDAIEFIKEEKRERVLE